MTETLAEARRENFGYGNGGKLTNGEASCNLKKAVRDGEKHSNKVCMAKKETNTASGETFKVKLTTAKCISAGLPDKFHHSTIDEFLRSSYTSWRVKWLDWWVDQSCYVYCLYTCIATLSEQPFVRTFTFACTVTFTCTARFTCTVTWLVQWLDLYSNLTCTVIWLVQ